MGSAVNGKPTNGSVVKVKSEPNGHPVGGLSNGIGSSLSTIKRAKPPTRSWTGWLTSNIARLAVWYTIITVLFRCPSDTGLIEDTTPRVCQSYLTTRDYVQPYLQPYYNTYASPYVEKVRPYTDQIHGRVIVPATAVTKKNYQKFAAPQIEKARQAAADQWQRSVVPQIQVAQAHAAKLYDANVAPQVGRVTSLTGPYYKQAKDATGSVYKESLLPALTLAQPYAQKGFASTQEFLIGTAYPAARHSWSTTVIFVDGTLWPFLKGLYSDNVRPQLVMISDRIAKYQESRKLQAIIDNAEGTSGTSASFADTTTAATKSAANATASASVAATDSDYDKIFQDEEEPAPEVKAPPPERPKPEQADSEKMAEELRTWQTKFAMAADKGTDDLRERAGELAADIAKTDIEGLGRGLETALQKTIENELDTVRSKIIAAVSTLPDQESSEAEKAAAEDVVKTIRASGLEIKTRAQKVRSWAEKFENDINLRIHKAAITTLEVLDDIRDLGLQEIGMRWAWMDGVTYKHWAKFHELKKQLNEWRDEVKAVALDHPEATQAKATARQILEECMALTEDAAKELVKLKEVAKWKIRAHDSTDDFELRAMPAAAASVAAEFAASSASLFGDAKETVASAASSVSSAAGDAVSSASSVIDPVTGYLDSLVGDATTGVQSIASSASSAVVGTPSYSYAGSIREQIQDLIDEAYEGISETVVELGTATETVSLGLASSASSAASAGIESASSVVLGTVGPAEAAKLSASSVILGSSGPVEQATASASSIASDTGEAAQDAASKASSIILGTTGTGEQIVMAASSVASDAGEAVQNAASSASSIASEASSDAASSASSVVSKGSSFLPGAMAQDAPKAQFPIFDDFFDDSETDSYSQKLQDMVNGAGDQYASVSTAQSPPNHCSPCKSPFHAHWRSC
jgi:hypothetical protein